MTAYDQVLLVDDDPTQTIILQAYFSGLGCRAIHEANSASEALNLLRNNGKIDLVVSDLMMPDMDGIELLRALKDIRFSGKIALISSLEQSIINSARKLAELHRLDMIGTCRKPLNRQKLDDLFRQQDRHHRHPHGTEHRIEDYRTIVEALETGRFVPFYQPKVNVLSKRIIGVEALARWRHPQRGLLLPRTFMPIIQTGRLSDKLTLNLMYYVFKDMARWQRAGHEIKVAVNITAHEVADINFPAKLEMQIRRFGLNASLLTLEITENEVLGFNATTLEVLSRLRMMGIGIAIDDFGTGYSNIKTLREFPYTELKIDQSFIRGISTDLFSQESVRTAATLGRQLNMKLLAEGVETSEEWEFIKRRGIDEVQGFYVAHPMCEADFMDFYKRNDGIAFLPGQADDEPLHNPVVAQIA